MSDSSDIFAASGVEAPVDTGPEADVYRVLARKYRPTRFSELIGQDAMVQTLANAIKRDRLAHAFLMTGVRGVGKTSTARLIAKALNCVGPDGQGGPTIDPCGQCDPCKGISEGRFIDVLEIDAASNTKVEQMRELLDNVPYASASARFKIYIIDEVHMLSNSSFNALLKTLEEPPEHVKFVFATTEVNKVPVTVLSRCQRFDLKRITTDLLSQHFGQIVEKEGVSAEQEALDIIAQAAEGSVRDGLSILDQAIAHAHIDDQSGEAVSAVTAQQVRDMLGLSDRGAIRRLFGVLLSGDAPELLDGIDEQYRCGVEPLSLLNGFLSLTHQVTLAKVGRVSDPTYSQEARETIMQWAQDISFPELHRLWQLLLKGQEEVRLAPSPKEACDMALLRVSAAGNMPDPGQLASLISQSAMAEGSQQDSKTASTGREAETAKINSASINIADNGPAAATPVSMVGSHGNDADFQGASDIDAAQNQVDVKHAAVEPSPDKHVTPKHDGTAANQDPSNAAATEEPSLPGSFADVAEMVGQQSPILEMILRSEFQVIEFEPPKIIFKAAKSVSQDDISKICGALKSATHTNWSLVQKNAETNDNAAPTLLEQQKNAEEAERQKILETPIVKAAFDAFPDATLMRKEDKKQMDNEPFNERSTGS